MHRPKLNLTNFKEKSFKEKRSGVSNDNHKLLLLFNWFTQGRCVSCWGGVRIILSTPASSPSSWQSCNIHRYQVGSGFALT
jgi:hypothetical protein